MTRRTAVALLAAAGALGAFLLMREPAPPSVRVTPGPVASPAAPRGYAVPRSARTVRDGRELARALARARPATILLAPGRYLPPSGGEPFFRAAAAHRIYARVPRTAVLEAGLEVGGNYAAGGARVRGLAFDVADPRRAPESSALHLWGVTGRDATVTDSTFRGHLRVDAGIRAYAVGGLTVERVRIAGFRRYGLWASDNDRRSTAAARRIVDVSVEGVRLQPPGSGDGRSEFGVWIGNPVRDPVARLRVRDFGWGGIWTGNRADDLVLRHLDVDGSARIDGVAIYIEHTTRRSVFERFDLGPEVKEGFVSEAAVDGSATGGGIDTVIRDGLIETRLGDGRAGVHLGRDTARTTIAGVRIVGADRACVVDAGTGTVLRRIECDGDMLDRPGGPFR